MSIQADGSNYTGNRDLLLLFACKQSLYRARHPCVMLSSSERGLGGFNKEIAIPKTGMVREKCFRFLLKTRRQRGENSKNAVGEAAIGGNVPLHGCVREIQEQVGNRSSIEKL